MTNRKIGNVMTKKSAKKAVAAVLALSLASGVCVCSLPVETSNSEALTYSVQNAERSSVTVKEVYEIGETFTVPQIDKTVEGATAMPMLVFPSGRAVSKNEIVLDEEGKYYLRYDFRKNGVLVDRDEYSFSVYRHAYDITGDATAEYAAGDGIKVALTDGTRLNFNEPIKVDDLRRGKPFATVEITPETKDVIDFCRIVFTLTDTSDLGNFVNIYIRNSNDSITQSNPEPFKSYSYGQACAYNQPATGYEPITDTLHVANEWGAPVPLSFWGKENSMLSVEFDAKTGEVAANGNLIVDLDDSEYFSDLWNGFDGDEVLLSVTADNFTRQTANFTVKSVIGKNLSRLYLTNDALPNISLTQAGAMPDGLVNHDYPIPEPQAYDSRGEKCQATARVYYGYDSKYQREISVLNGKFVPNRTGDYTIVYIATDKFGQKSERVVTVHIKDSLPRITVGATASGRRTSAYVGERVGIADIVAAGGTGKLTTAVEVIYNGEKCEISGGAFVPVKSGKYDVIYTATDYIGRKATYVYNIDVTYSSEPVIGHIELPLSYVGGFTYDIPVPQAYVYTTGGKTESPVTATVILGDKELTVENGKVDISAVAEDTVATVRYKSGNTVADYTAQVLQGKTQSGNILFSSFFSTSESVTAEQISNAVRLTANHDGTASFERELVGNGLNCGISFSSGFAYCDGVDLVVTDVNDATESVRASFTSGADGNLYVSVGGGIAKSLGLAPNDSINVSLDNSRITFGSNMRLDIKTFENGKPYSGFSSGLVKIRLEWKGVIGATSVDVSAISRQSFRDGATDNRAPNIGLIDKYELLHGIGETVTVPVAVCADVINTQCTFSVTVKKPNGDIAAAIDGTKLENADPSASYDIKLDEYGEYIAEYTATDVSNERSTTITVRFIVENKVVPEIEYAFTPITTGTVGNAIAVPKAIVKGSNDVTYTITRILIMPDRSSADLSDEYYDSFIPTVTGEYTVRYIITDDSGNFAVYEYAVNVSEV